jgi:hypothetical protein
MREILGIEGRDVKTAVIDMCYSMIELKLASKKDKYVSNVCYLDDTELSFENVCQFWSLKISTFGRNMACYHKT